jgi:hypothetical protein
MPPDTPPIAAARAAVAHAARAWEGRARRGRLDWVESQDLWRRELLARVEDWRRMVEEAASANRAMHLRGDYAPKDPEPRP